MSKLIVRPPMGYTQPIGPQLVNLGKAWSEENPMGLIDGQLGVISVHKNGAHKAYVEGEHNSRIERILVKDRLLKTLRIEATRRNRSKHAVIDPNKHTPHNPLASISTIELLAELVRRENLARMA